MNLGVPEILLILAVALLFFGPSRLPSLGKSIGEAIRGFKKGMTETVDLDAIARKDDSNSKLSGSNQNKTAYHAETEVEKETDKKKV